MPQNLHLFNTLTRRKELFTAPAGDVSLYVCGVTPYDTTHLGHAFTFLAFDVLVRYLEYLGYRVRYVQNITDVDDPLFERAARLGVSYQQLAEEQTAQFMADVQALHMRPIDVQPRASRHIEGMVELIGDLLEGDHAYVVDGNVYFNVSSDPTYGVLSKLGRTEMIELARERGGDPDDPLRRDPLDFLLWRRAGEGEPEFDSPWGRGLPGWHIECSTMSLEYLGSPVDIHGGGEDLIFPHHESEIAQSEAATGRHPFSRYWVHVAMVYMDGEKMSKSLGNMVFVRDLVPQFGADAVRLYLLDCHYRSSLHYDERGLERARELADRLARAAQWTGSEGTEGDTAAHRDRFLAAMDDDLNSPAAIAVLSELADEIVSGRVGGEGPAALQELGSILGLRLGG